MADKRAITMQLSGNDYAKVAERIKLFREDWKDGKIETDHTTNEDGSVEYSAWIWKNKTDLLELMKAGITDKETLRSSADADGNSKGEVGKKVKDFEKLQTIAVGRALANLGYLGSGDVASFEEMEEFTKYKEQEKAEAIKNAIELLKGTKTLDDLKECYLALGTTGTIKEVWEVKEARKKELA
jgi:hypothetical protein